MTARARRRYTAELGFDSRTSTSPCHTRNHYSPPPAPSNPPTPHSDPAPPAFATHHSPAASYRKATLPLCFVLFLFLILNFWIDKQFIDSRCRQLSARPWAQVARPTLNHPQGA